MAECQNFFDDKSPSICNSSSSGEQQQQQQSSPPPAGADGNAAAEDRHLELRLGPSVVDGSKPKLHEMVRPIPVYRSLDRQLSGSFGSATGSSPLFRGQSDSFMGEKALFSKDSAFSTPPLVSRDQVWRSLQNSSARRESDPLQAGAEDSAASVMCRRSASMQLLISSNEGNEQIACPPPRRSCSNSISAGLLSRQSSFGQEVLIDENCDLANSAARQQQPDALDLQTKKEIQAHRRLEAKKRRRLILEKQQKKPRQCNLPVVKQSVSPVEKASLVRTYTLDRKYSLECKPRLEITASKIADGEKMTNSLCVEDPHNGLLSYAMHQDTDDRGRCCGSMGRERENESKGNMGIRGAVSNVRQMIAAFDLSALSGSKGREQGETNVEMSDASNMLPSSCSETESTETKEKEMYASERESSSQKSSTDNPTSHSSSAAFASASSNPMLCPQTSPGASSVSSKLQVMCSQQWPPHEPPRKSSVNEELNARQAPCHPDADLLSEVPDNFTIKRSVGVFSEGKWRIPDEDPHGLPLRRTASTMNEAVLQQHSMVKKLETQASLSASQLKSGKVLFDEFTKVNPLRTSQVQFRLSSKLHALDKVVNKVAKVEHMFTPIKVKEEQDVTDGEIPNCFATANPLGPGRLKSENEPIKRQISASFSELPGVTTTGSGPNGRTINGVMYITSSRSVRLVCRCHGKHMSPAEFVEHAGSTDVSNPLRNIVVNSFSMPNHLTSTPV